MSERFIERIFLLVVADFLGKTVSFFTAIPRGGGSE